MFDYKKLMEQRAARIKKEREAEYADWMLYHRSMDNNKTDLSAIIQFLNKIETQTAGSLGVAWKARERIDINDNPIFEFSAEPADRERQDHWWNDEIDDDELYDDWQTRWASPLEREIENLLSERFSTLKANKYWFEKLPSGYIHKQPAWSVDVNEKGFVEFDFFRSLINNDL